MQAPVLVLKDSLTRESGSKVHHANIQASKAVADIIRTTLGPRSMLKMLLDAAGGIVVTNDGDAILRELDIAHPAAKSMIELSRTDASAKLEGAPNHNDDVSHDHSPIQIMPTVRRSSRARKMPAKFKD